MRRVTRRALPERKDLFAVATTNGPARHLLELPEKCWTVCCNDFDFAIKRMSPKSNTLLDLLTRFRLKPTDVTVVLSSAANFPGGIAGAYCDTLRGKKCLVGSSKR